MKDILKALTDAKSVLELTPTNETSFSSLKKKNAIKDIDEAILKIRSQKPVKFIIKAFKNSGRSEFSVVSDDNHPKAKDFPKGYELGGGYEVTPLFTYPQDKITRGLSSLDKAQLAEELSKELNLEDKIKIKVVIDSVESIVLSKN